MLMHIFLKNFRFKIFSVILPRIALTAENINLFISLWNFFFRIAHMRILDKLKFVSLSVIKRQKLPSFSVMAYCCLFFWHMNIKFQNLIEEK